MVFSSALRLFEQSHTKKQPPGKIIIKKVANKFHRASQVVLQVQPGSSQGLTVVSRLVVFSFLKPLPSAQVRLVLPCFS